MSSGIRFAANVWARRPLVRWMEVPPLVLATASCGLLGGGDAADTDSRPLEEDEQSAGSAEVQVPNDFVRETMLFNSSSQENVGAEVEIQAVEATEDSTALHFSIANLGETFENADLDTTTPFLVDPVDGEGYIPLLDGDPDDSDTRGYSSHDDGSTVGPPPARRSAS